MVRIFLMTCLTISTLASASAPEKISVPKKLLKTLKSFETSAVISLSGTDKFLVSSDDTTEENAPLLFIMDKNGQVDKTPVVIQGMDKMTDIESLIQDSGYIYALSSQSRNKKGKVLRERNLFVRGKLKGTNITDTQVIELRAELIKALKLASDIRIQNMKDKFEQLIEIEASYIKNGLLFVGLKDSQPEAGVSLVLELGQVEAIFKNEKLDPSQIKVAAEINFNQSGGTEEKISDISVSSDGTLIMTATLENGGGSVWSFDKNSKLTQLQAYEAEKPEGICLLEGGQAMVVFDQGDEPSLYSYITLP